MCTMAELRAPPLRLPALRALAPLMLMIRPQPSIFMKGMTAREQRSAPTYFTLKSSSKSSSMTVSIGPVAVVEPPGAEPLLTRMCRPPSCCAALATVSRLPCGASSHATRRWRKGDSNSWSHRKRDAVPITTSPAKCDNVRRAVSFATLQTTTYRRGFAEISVLRLLRHWRDHFHLRRPACGRERSGDRHRLAADHRPLRLWGDDRRPVLRQLSGRHRPGFGSHLWPHRRSRRGQVWVEQPRHRGSG